MAKREEQLANYAAQKKALCVENDTISDSLFQEYGVNRGLRDVNGKGVLTGLTNISKIVSFKDDENGKTVPCDGELWYRGYNVKTLINSIGKDEFGFEEVTYLLLFGELPDKQELKEFCQVLGESRTLPTNFTRDVIMKAPSKDIMNSMTRSIPIRLLTGRLTSSLLLRASVPRVIVRTILRASRRLSLMHILRKAPLLSILLSTRILRYFP